jgi:hypothetical protein
MRRAAFAVLAVALLAGCGGARTHVLATAEPPTPSGDPIPAALQGSFEHGAQIFVPSWDTIPLDTAHSVEVAASGGSALYWVPAGPVWCLGLAQGATFTDTACSPRAGSPPSVEASFSGPPENTVLYGWAAAPATRAEVSLGDGRTQALDLHQGFFLATVASRPQTVTAYDARGTAVGTTHLPALPGPAAPRSVTVPLTGGGTASIGIAASGACGDWQLQGARSDDGHTVRSIEVWGGEGASDPAPGLSVMAFPGDLTVVSGTLTGQAMSATMTLSDGTTSSVPVNGRCVFTSVGSGDDTATRHPRSVTWHDASGTTHELPVQADWPQFLSDDL